MTLMKYKAGGLYCKTLKETWCICKKFTVSIFYLFNYDICQCKKSMIMVIFQALGQRLSKDYGLGQIIKKHWLDKRGHVYFFNTVFNQNHDLSISHSEGISDKIHFGKTRYFIFVCKRLMRLTGGKPLMWGLNGKHVTFMVLRILETNTDCVKALTYPSIIVNANCSIHSEKS